MNTSARIRPVACTALTLVLASSAHAQVQVQVQVQKCQVEGKLVFQGGPCGLAPRATTAAPNPVAVAANPSKKRTLADLLRERDAADGARPTVREVQDDGANVLRARMGAV